MAESLPKLIDDASNAKAALYVWDTIAAILESGADPGRYNEESADACEVILEMVRDQQQVALRAYDKAIAQAKRLQGGESEPR